MTSWQQDRRRAASRQFTSDNARALASLVGGLGDARDMLLDDEERKRKKDADTATQGLLRARTDAAKTTAESGLLKAKADEATSQEKLLRAKSESEEKSARVTREAAADEAKKQSDLEKSSMEALRVSARAPDANVETLIGRASVDPGLGNLDDTAVAGILAEEQAKAGIQAATTNKNKALAAKARRVPVAKAPAPRSSGGAPSAAVGPQPKQLTTGEAQAVIELQGAQDILAKLGEKKATGGAGGSEIDTGPIEAAQDWIAARLGVESPEKTEFKALAGSQLAEYIKSISGATVSEPERAKLLENVPTPADNDAAFMAKLKAVQTILDTKLETLRRVYEASGRDTKVFSRPPAPAPAATPAPSAKVRVSNGQEILEIDRADLGDALADGYKVVR